MDVHLCTSILMGHRHLQQHRRRLRRHRSRRHRNYKRHSAKKRDERKHAQERGATEPSISRLHLHCMHCHRRHLLATHRCSLVHIHQSDRSRLHRNCKRHSAEKRDERSMPKNEARPSPLSRDCTYIACTVAVVISWPPVGTAWCTLACRIAVAVIEIACSVLPKKGMSTV